MRETNQSESALREKVIEFLKTVRDPEIPVNVYDLGLIYDVSADGDGKVSVTMTLTTPACPVAQSLPEQVETGIKYIEGVSGATVEVVWDPPWSKEMMSEAARLELGLV